MPNVHRAFTRKRYIKRNRVHLFLNQVDVTHNRKWAANGTFNCIEQNRLICGPMT